MEVKKSQKWTKDGVEKAVLSFFCTIGSLAVLHIRIFFSRLEPGLGPLPVGGPQWMGARSGSSRFPIRPGFPDSSDSWSLGGTFSPPAREPRGGPQEIPQDLLLFESWGAGPPRVGCPKAQVKDLLDPPPKKPNKAPYPGPWLNNGKEEDGGNGKSVPVTFPPPVHAGGS